MIIQSPTPPPWSARSVEEDGGVTHEVVCAIEPKARASWGADPVEHVRPTQISLSVVDRPEEHGWVRSAPTLQIEGGSFPLGEAVRIREAIDALLAVATSPDETRATHAERPGATR